MDKVLESAKKLSDEMKREPVVVEFLRLKELFENDKELASMRKKIARLSTLEDKKEYNELKQMYDNHPLVSNYYQLRDEVMNLFEEIRDIIL